MNAIEFDNIGKLYQLGTVGTGTLSHDLNRWWQTKVLGHEDPYLKVGETNDRASKGTSGFVWALKDISFNVAEGEVVGIIGKNGAGKSTLLKLLSRVTAPTTGEIRARGRIASLLEVGTGFNGEMTGRENIFMNGSIMGMTRAEIRSKLDDIVDFAGVARYLDTPVKRYSSGMTVRLGFAVAAFLEPEILVVDEVLAVGDAEFQKKAIGKMQDVSRGQGRTVLFVSHNMSAVRSLCTRGILLENGSVGYIGTTEDAIARYMQKSEDNQHVRIVDHVRWSKSYLRIDNIVVNGTDKDKSEIIRGQRILDFRLDGYAHSNCKTDLIVILRNSFDVPLASLYSGKYNGAPIIIKEGSFSIVRKVLLPKYIARGEYVMDIILKDPLAEYHMGARHSVFLTVEGNCDDNCHPIDQGSYGFMGLELVADES